MEHPAPGAHPRSIAQLVLTGLDGTGVSAVASQVAKRLGARLYQVEVSSPGGGHGEPRRSPAGRRPSSGPVLARREGLPAIELVRYGESVAADLLILGRGEARHAGALPGEDLVAEVVRRADVPCLIVPNGQRHLARMLVALDGSERGMRAMGVGWALRGLSEGEIRAIFVDSATDPAPAASVPSLVVSRVVHWMALLAAPETPPPLIHRHGDVVKETMRDLSPLAGDVLVVGVRRGGPTGTAESTGSGRRLLAAAPCAVLAVPL